MQTGDKFWSVLAGVLVVLAFVLKAVIPQVYRLGIGSRFYRSDSLVFWAFLWAGIAVGVIVIIKIIVRSYAV